MSKEEIINLFYIKHLKIKDIAEKINTSNAYVTKIIKQDSRYIEEKEYRKGRSLVLSRERSEWMTVLASDSLSQI